MKVKVTQSHIDQGIQRVNDYCPIALALKEKPGVGGARVFFDSVDLVGGATTKFYELPKKAREFIERFDENRNSVKPFSFVMRKRK